MTPAEVAVEEALWSKVEADFGGDNEAHAAYIEHCCNVGALPDAASRYRSYRDSRGEELSDEERSQLDRRNKAIALLAVNALKQDTSLPSAKNFRRLLNLFVALFFIASLLGLAWMMSL